MAGKRSKGKVPSAELALYEKLIATNSRVERKGDRMPYTSLNGHMFTFLSESGSLAIRLPPPEREEFLRKYKTTLFKTSGTVLKEYVTVPPELLKRTAELKKAFVASYSYVGALKPKIRKGS
ncbi:MAG: hypothetical protein WD906_00845 [Anaerolineales bacterium]